MIRRDELMNKLMTFQETFVGLSIDKDGCVDVCDVNEDTKERSEVEPIFIGRIRMKGDLDD